MQRLDKRLREAWFLNCLLSYQLSGTGWPGHFLLPEVAHRGGQAPNSAWTLFEKRMLSARSCGQLNGGDSCWENPKALRQHANRVTPEASSTGVSTTCRTRALRTSSRRAWATESTRYIAGMRRRTISLTSSCRRENLKGAPGKALRLRGSFRARSRTTVGPKPSVEVVACLSLTEQRIVIAMELLFRPTRVEA